MSETRLPTPLSWPRRLAFSGVAIVLFFGLAELVARFFQPPSCGTAALLRAHYNQQQSRAQSGHSSLNRSIPMPYDPFLIWHMMTSFHGNNLGVQVDHNSLGLRSPEIPLQKPPGTVRILLSGDSTIYGHGIEEGALLRTGLERDLKAAAPGRAIQVVNGGVPGYSSLQSLNQLKRLTRKYQPDILVIANLWSDAMLDEFEDRTLIYGEGARAILVQAAQWTDDLLASRSALFCLLKRIVHLGPRGDCTPNKPLCAPPPGEVPTAMLKPIRVGEGDVVVGQGGVRTVRQAGKAVESGRTARVSLPDYRKNLEALASVARSYGMKVIFVMLACRHDVGEEDGNHPQPAEYQPYRKVMREVASSLDAALVDMPASFAQARATTTVPLFLDLVHPSAEGNAIMIRALGRALLEDGRYRETIVGQ